MKLTQLPLPKLKRHTPILNYRSYTNRLLSFKKAPKHLISKAKRMANAGLFYTNKADEVQCYRCHTTIGEWTEANTPFDIRQRITKKQNLHKIPTLNNILQPLHYFQAAARLNHYLLFPFMLITNKQIDESTRHTWDYTLHATLKKAYEFKNTSITVTHIRHLQTKYNAASTEQPNTPLQWYRRIADMKHFIKYKTLTTRILDINLLQKWEHLENIHRRLYYNLSHVDTKRHDAIQLEAIINSTGLTIGSSNDQPNNIVIKPYEDNDKIIPISTRLSRKITILISEITK